MKRRGKCLKKSVLEKLYEINGLIDYRLKTLDDLLKVHDIDYREVDGYNRLDDLNRKLYEKFIVNFYNAQGLDSRAALNPLGIYYVEDYEYIARENPEDDFYVTTESFVMVIDRNGLKTVHEHFKDEKYSNLESIRVKSKFYLRFEYEHYGTKTWQHVIDEHTWY